MPDPWSSLRPKLTALMLITGSGLLASSAEAQPFDYPFYRYGFGPYAYQDRVTTYCRREEATRRQLYLKHQHLQEWPDYFDLYCADGPYILKPIRSCARGICGWK